MLLEARPAMAPQKEFAFSLKGVGESWKAGRVPVVQCSSKMPLTAIWKVNWRWDDECRHQRSLKLGSRHRKCRQQL